jgi:O-antigen/teichoic acid export membrane protein
MVIQGIGLIVTLISLDFVFQGLQRMGVIAARQVAASLLVLIAVLVLIEGRDDVYVAAAIPVAATGLTAIWLLFRIRRGVGAIAFRVRFGESKTVLRVILPFAVSGTMSTIFYNTDIVMLGFLADHRAVGLYVGAYRMFVISLIVGSLIGASYGPALAASWRDDALRRSGFQEFIGAMFFVGMPIAAAGIAFPGEVMALVFGVEFEPAQGAFVILMAAVAFTYVAAAGGVSLIAWNDQTAHMVILTLGAVANVVANLALIPPFGIIGAAGATLTCQGIVAIAILVRIHRRHVTVEAARLARPMLCAAAAFAAARVLFEIVVALRPDWSGAPGFLACAVLGGALYVGLAIVFGAVDLARLRTAILDRAAGGGG